jgi:uncharacterized protein YbcV (DUF1398 family)
MTTMPSRQGIYLDVFVTCRKMLDRHPFFQLLSSRNVVPAHAYSSEMNQYIVYTNEKNVFSAGLPDGLFSNLKSKFG